MVMEHGYGSSILRDNTNSMAFDGVNTGSALPDYPPQHPSSNPYALVSTPDRHANSPANSQVKTNQLNPSVPQFTPNGSELKLYQRSLLTPPTTPPTDGTSHAMGPFERLVADTHLQHAAEVAKVKYLTLQNQTEIEQTKEAVGHDLQNLQSQLEQLRDQFTKHHEADQSLAAVKRSVGIFEPEIVPPEIMLQRFDRETAAQVYLEQAAASEELARKLRQEAEALSADDKTPRQGDQKLLEQPKGNGAGGDDHGVIENGGGDFETPTHMPPRHTQREKPSHAVTIKAPGDDEAQAPSADPQPQKVEPKQPWQPLAVRNMPPIAVNIPATSPITFSTEFLLKELGGKYWCPGFWFIAEDTTVKSKSYWLLDGEHEPFLPSEPGQHGAKLTPFFNPTLCKPGQAPRVENYMDCPVFIMKEGDNEYTYFGQYSQLRFADKLDHDRMMDTVPEKVRKYWAEELAVERKPEWVTRALMEHFWPRPVYEGPVSTDSAVNTPATADTAQTDGSTVVLEKRAQDALQAYDMELKEWEKETHIKASHLTAEAIEAAFGEADAEEEPGLRLHWEYFQCIGYDQNFYDAMVQKQDTEKANKMKAAAARQAKAKLAAAKAMKDSRGGKAGRGKAAPQEDMFSNAAMAGYEPTSAPKFAPAAWCSAWTETAKPIAADKKVLEQEKPAESKPATEPKQPNGFSADSLKAAKDFQDSATKSQPRRNGNGNAGRGKLYVGPHQRERKSDMSADRAHVRW